MDVEKSLPCCSTIITNDKVPLQLWDIYKTRVRAWDSNLIVLKHDQEPDHIKSPDPHL